MDSSETQDPVGKPAAVDAERPKDKYEQARHPLGVIFEPIQWIRMLCRELNPSFVFGVIVVYGLSQGLAGSFFKVVTDYYWKDVQKVQPSAVQVFIGLYYIPWLMKPVWGLLTDAVSVCGYQRRPYFIAAGILGITGTVAVSTSGKLPVALALVCLIGVMAMVAIADVTIDACIARNSMNHPSLAPDMQSLSNFFFSLASLIGFAISGVLVHKLGPQGALAFMIIPAAMLVLLGFVIYEEPNKKHEKKQKVSERMGEVARGMRRAMQSSAVWKPTLFMYLSLALSLNTTEGQFYWFTDPKAGPAFSQEFVGITYALGATASMLGVVIYQKLLRGYSFRSLLFYVQLLYGVSGFFDLLFVLRWNLKLHIPDFVFVVLEECCARLIIRIRWIPMLVLNTKLCPKGIEGTFFALLMCIDSLGTLSSKVGGGLLLHLLHVTRTDFKNLWFALLIRNMLRISALGLIFLVPRAVQSDVLLPPDLLHASNNGEEEGLQLMEQRDDEEVQRM